MSVRALRLRALPSSSQQKKIDTTIDCCRFVKNHMIERNRKVYARRKEHLGYNAMQNLLPVMKGYLPWLKEADSQALKYACRQVDDAYRRFFKKLGGYPRFKSKRAAVQSYTTTNASSIRCAPGRVKLPCLGWMPVQDGRSLPARTKICRAAVIRDHGHYFVSIIYKTDDTVVTHPVDEGSVIGLDYKSDGLYASSEGHVCGMPHWYRLSEQAIAREHRKLSKKRGSHKGEKPSGNFRRQQKRLFKKARHAANQRKDFLHKQSTEIANQYDAVCVEDLNLKAMSNKGLGNGKATLDNGYGAFLRMLDYKLHDRGKSLVRIDRWYPSSQICSACGYRNPEVKDLSVRKWTCRVCGAMHDRDFNAAVNIRNEGIKIIKHMHTA